MTLPPDLAAADPDQSLATVGLQLLFLSPLAFAALAVIVALIRKWFVMAGTLPSSSLPAQARPRQAEGGAC